MHAHGPLMSWVKVNLWAKWELSQPVDILIYTGVLHVQQPLAMNNPALWWKFDIFPHVLYIREMTILPMFMQFFFYFFNLCDIEQKSPSCLAVLMRLMIYLWSPRWGMLFRGLQWLADLLGMDSKEKHCAFSLKWKGFTMWSRMRKPSFLYFMLVLVWNFLSLRRCYTPI